MIAWQGLLVHYEFAARFSYLLSFVIDTVHTCIHLNTIQYYDDIVYLLITHKNDTVLAINLLP